MGSPSEEKLKIIEVMNQTLNNIDKRRRELNANLDMEEDENQVAEIKKELGQLESQATAVKGARDEFEQQYAKLKTEEEKKKFEHIVKMAIIVGMTSESIRIAWEKEKQVETDREAQRLEKEALRKERYEKAIDRIFETMTLRYVTREMIDEIKDNKKFKEMAEEDPDRLNREELARKDEYTAMMARTFVRHRMSLTGDFNKDQEQLKEAYEKETGYEKAIPLMKKFIEGDLEKYGTEEDKKFIKDLYKDVVEISAITRKLRNEFIAGESDFFKGNGFTKEIYEKEKSIYDRLYMYKEKVNAQNLEFAEKGEMDKMADRMNIYNPIVVFEGNIKTTYLEDEDQYKANEFRKETEMWKVYQKLPDGSAAQVKHVTEKANNEMRAWSKIQRMTKMAMIEGKGSLSSCLYEWANTKAQALLKKAVDKKKFDAKDRDELKENFSAIVFNQLVYNEQKGTDLDKPFSEMVFRKYNKPAELDEIGRKFAATPTFEAVYKKYMKGGNYKDKCIRFLAKDVEKQLALELVSKKDDLLAEMLQANMNLSRSKSVALRRNDTIKKPDKSKNNTKNKSKNNTKKNSKNNSKNNNSKKSALERQTTVAEKERVRSQTIMPS